MSDTAPLLKKVFSYGTVSSVTVGAIFLLHILAGRFLGVEAYGRFSFVLAFATVCAPMLDLGLYYLLIREIARDDTAGERYLAHTLTWKLLSGPAFLLVVALGADAIHDGTDILQAAVLIGGAQILLSLKDAFRPVLLARERFDLDALSLAIERLSLLGAAALVLLTGGGLLALCWTFLVVRALDLVIIGAMVGRMFPVRVGRDMGFLRATLRAALPIGGFYLTLTIYNYVDTVLISWIRGDQEVGWYAAAYKLYEGPVLIPAIIGTVFMPRLSRFFLQDRERFVSIVRQGLEWVVGASLIVTAIGMLAAGWLVDLSYGVDFGAATVALRILLAGLLFAFSINFLQTVMISIDQQRIVFLAAVGGLVANVALNLLFIPVWGYVGASWATVLVEGLVFLVLATFAWRHIRASSFLVPAGTGPHGAG